LTSFEKPANPEKPEDFFAMHLLMDFREPDLMLCQCLSKKKYNKFAMISTTVGWFFLVFPVDMTVFSLGTSSNAERLNSDTRGGGASRASTNANLQPHASQPCS
jgi:hypothetical protein